MPYVKTRAYHRVMRPTPEKRPSIRTSALVLNTSKMLLASFTTTLMVPCCDGGGDVVCFGWVSLLVGPPRSHPGTRHFGRYVTANAVCVCVVCVGVLVSWCGFFVLCSVVLALFFLRSSASSQCLLSSHTLSQRDKFLPRGSVEVLECDKFRGRRPLPLLDHGTSTSPQCLPHF